MTKKISKEELKQPDAFHSLAEKLAIQIQNFWIPIAAILAIAIVGGLVRIVMDWNDQRQISAQTEKLYSVIKRQEDAEKTINDKEEKRIKELQAEHEKNQAKTKEKDKKPFQPPEPSKGDFATDFQPLVEEYEKLVGEFKTGDVVARAALQAADVYQRFDKFAQAAQILKKVVGHSSPDSIADVLLRMSLSYNLMQTDQLKDAVDVISPLTKNKTQKFIQGQAALRLGIIYLKLNNLAEARATFSRVTTEFANTDAAKQAENYLRFIEFQGQNG